MLSLLSAGGTTALPGPCSRVKKFTDSILTHAADCNILKDCFVWQLKKGSA